MKRRGDKATRGQGDEEPARAASVPLSPCRRVSSSLRLGAFTLPEVLASLVLVGLVLPAVMKCVSLSVAASDDARKRMEAVALAEQKLSELTASATSTSSGSTTGDFGAERPGFRFEATMNSVDTALLEIRVRVTWHGRGTDRSVDLATFAYTGAGSAGSAGTMTTPPPGGTP